MVQFFPPLDFLGLVFIVIGIIVILVGILLTSRREEVVNDESKRNSKGVVFLGPLPIIWGFSRRTQIIIAIIGISLFTVYILWLML